MKEVLLFHHQFQIRCTHTIFSLLTLSTSFSDLPSGAFLFFFLKSIFWNFSSRLWVVKVIRLVYIRSLNFALILERYFADSYLLPTCRNIFPTFWFFLFPSLVVSDRWLTYPFSARNLSCPSDTFTFFSLSPAAFGFTKLCPDGKIASLNWSFWRFVGLTEYEDSVFHQSWKM